MLERTLSMCVMFLVFLDMFVYYNGPDLELLYPPSHEIIYWWTHGIEGREKGQLTLRNKACLWDNEGGSSGQVVCEGVCVCVCVWVCEIAAMWEEKEGE